MAKVRTVENPFWVKRLDSIVDDEIGEVAEAIRRDAGLRYAPRGATKRLMNSFIVVKPRGLVRHIGSTLFYWRFAEKGTEPHIITPGSAGRSGSVSGTPERSGKALWWPGAGRPRQAVSHPGGKAKSHLKRALYKKRRL